MLVLLWFVSGTDVETKTAEGGSVDVLVKTRTVTEPSASVEDDWEVIISGGGVDVVKTDEMVELGGLGGLEGLVTWAQDDS